MKMKIMALAIITALIGFNYAFAAEGHDHHEDKGSMAEHRESEEKSEAVNVNNKICPVSGENVKDMGGGIAYEYNGKAYNFCCAGCVATFKKDPEKYVKIVQEQMGQEMAMTSEDGHVEHHHMMGEKDEHMMMEAADEKSTQTKERSVPGAQVEEFDLEAYQHGYSPERITVKKGSIVKLHATSRDVPHGIFIKEYGINVPVKKGAVEEIKFVADKAGEFNILCSVYCGKGHGSMKAKLIVEE